ncbi:unnamed protein product [Closterium sp. NIES-64]|nr:unnamed protein product [Closterium sp. NIES-64]
MASLTLGEVVPNLEFDSTGGRMKLHDFVGDSWAVVFSHPGDFTPVCTTELGKIALRSGEFEQRGVKLIGLSCDSVEDHVAWIKDIEAYTPGAKVTYPIIADPSRDLAQKLNMLDPDLKDSNGRPLTSRALHIIGPDKKLKLSFLYPGSVGRNFDEVLRAIDALQLAADRQIATPSDWKKGDRVVVPPSLSEDEASKKFPGHETVELPSGKKYLRFTDLNLSSFPTFSPLSTAPSSGRTLRASRARRDAPTAPARGPLHSDAVYLAPTRFSISDAFIFSLVHGGRWCARVHARMDGEDEAEQQAALGVLQRAAPCGEAAAGRVARQLTAAVNQFRVRNVMRLHARGEDLLLFGPRMAADISMLDPATQHLVTAARDRISEAGRHQFEAPECAGSGGEGESDMWMVGALVFFLLSGRPPFAVSSEAGVATAHGDAADSADVCSPPWPPMSAAARHFLSRLLCRLPAQRATPNEALGNAWVESMCAQALNEDHPVAPRPQQALPVGETRGGASAGRARGGRRARVCFREVEETERGDKEEEEERRGGASKAAYVEGWLAASGVRGGDDVEGGEGGPRGGSDGGAHDGEHDRRDGGGEAHAAQGFGSPTAHSEERRWQGGGGGGGTDTTQVGGDAGRGRGGVGGGGAVRAAAGVSFVLDECDFSAMLDRDHVSAVGNFATLPARLSRRADATNIASASSPPLPGRSMPPLPSLSSDSRARSSALPPRHSPDCTGAGGRRQLLPAGSRSMPHDSAGRATGSSGRAGSPEVSSDYAAALATASHRVERQLLSTLRAPRGSRSMVLTSTAPPAAASAMEGSGGWQSVDFSELVEPGPGGARSSGGAGEAVDVAQLVPLVQVGDHTVDNLLCDFDHLNATPPRPHPGSDAEPWPDGGSSSGRQWSAPSSDSGDLDLSAMDLNGPTDVGGAGGAGGEGPLGAEQSMIVDALGRRLLKSPMASPHPRRKHGRSSHVFC